MNKTEELTKLYLEIDTSAEISHATLTNLMENEEDDRTQYILLGVIQQLENIKKQMEMFGKIMVGGAVA